jgi:hypothetical protein
MTGAFALAREKPHTSSTNAAIDASEYTAFQGNGPSAAT